MICNYARDYDYQAGIFTLVAILFALPLITLSSLALFFFCLFKYIVY